MLVHTMNELSPLDSVFRIHECLVQCVSSSLKNVVHRFHVVFGLPLVRDPGVVPCIICFSKLSDFFLMVCPNCVHFLAFADSRRCLLALSSIYTHAVICTIHSHVVSVQQYDRLRRKLCYRRENPRDAAVNFDTTPIPPYFRGVSGGPDRPPWGQPEQKP